MLAGRVVFIPMLPTLAGSADKIDGWLDMLAMLDGLLAMLFSMVGWICCSCCLAVWLCWVNDYWQANMPADLTLLPG
jgi:hypothetical protein